GMTVRPLASMTKVAGPRWRRISSLAPAATNLPPSIATASTNDEARLVAILALCRMTSAGMETSFAAHESPLAASFQLAGTTDQLKACRHYGSPGHQCTSLPRDFLCFPIALHHRLVARRYHRVELSELGGVGAIPGAMHFANDSVGAGRNDASLREACERRSRCHFARVA